MTAMRRRPAAVPLLAGFLVLTMALLPAGALHAEEADNRALLKAFAGVALGAEHEKRKPRIIKWKKPVNLAIIGRGYPPLFEDLVVKQVDDLTKTTGHPMRLVFSETMRREKRLPANVSKIPINMLVFFAPKAELPALVEKRTNGAFKAPDVARLVKIGLCHGRLRINKSGELTFGYAAVPAEMVTRVQYGDKRVDPRVLLRACVVEEITQLMGLVNDISGLEFSIFSDTSRHVDLTAEDRWMLRMLYDPRMRPGMAPKPALGVAVKFLRENRPGK